MTPLAADCPGGPAEGCPERRLGLPVGRVGLLAFAFAVSSIVTASCRPVSATAESVPGFVPSSTVPVSAALLVCPDPSASGRVGSRLDVSADPEDPTGRLRASVGRVELGPVPSAGGHAGRGLVFERAGDPRPAPAGSARQPVVLDAAGPVAAGLAATVTGHAGGESGPARMRCARPGEVTHVVGPATVAGRDPLLVVANIGGVDARADVEVLGEHGGGERTEVVVASGASVVRRLVEMAPESMATAVSVRQHTGRVVAWLVDRPSRGSPTAEVAVPPTAEPGRRLVVGGLPASGAEPAGADSPEGSATLVVATPGEAARVDVTLLTERGPVTPAGMRGRRFEAGSVEAVRLGLPGGASFAAVVTVTSGGPVTAAVGVPGSASGGLTWAGAAAPEGLLTGDEHADVWVPPLPKQSTGAVVLTAPGPTATAWLDGSLVRVPAGRTVTVPLKAGFPGGRLVTVDGPVVAAQRLGPVPDSGVSADGDEPGAGWPSSVTAIAQAPRVVHVPELVADPRLAG
jgi:hypothetical protein